MAVTAVKAVLERSRAKGKERMVLFVLAEAVNEGQVERGLPWEAWPSQATIAKRANCSDRLVRAALKELKALGEIRDAGKPVGKGARTYVLTLPTTPRTDDEKPEPRKTGSGVGRKTPSGLGRKTSSGNPGRRVPTNQKEPETRTGHGEPDKAPRSALASLPDPLPEYEGLEVTAYEWMDADAILDALNGLRETEAGKAVKPWALAGPNGNLTQNGRVLIHRLRFSPEHDAASFIEIAKKNFADPPTWSADKPLKSAAGIFGNDAWPGASVYRPHDPAEHQRITEAREAIARKKEQVF